MRIAAISVLMFISMCICAKEIEFTFKSSYDSTEQKCAGYVPDSYDGKKPLPLLVIAHSMGCTRFQAKSLGYYEIAERDGFLVVCPELHGERSPGGTSLASLQAQRDILDSIKYMQDNFKINDSRIYLSGRSMGGMLAMVMAAKYPGKFAAVMAGQGIYDLPEWMRTTPENLKKASLKEMGKEPDDSNRFEYARRSAINYASNTKYTAVFMWHGTNDTWVPVEQANAMFEVMRGFNRYQAPVFYRPAASHCELNYPPEWIWGQLKTYENKPEMGMKISGRFFRELEFVMDENNDFFYIGIELKDKNAFAKVKASFEGDTLSVKAENVSALKVYADKVPFKISKIKTDSDSECSLELIGNGKSILSKEPSKKHEINIEKQTP